MCVVSLLRFFLINKNYQLIADLFEMKTTDFEWRGKTLETVYLKIVYLLAGLAFRVS